MNIYWPVYLNIENEVNKLMNSIHMDDCHLEVYSSLISDLILRAATEIESIAKELYVKNGGEKTSGIRFDYDALTHLEKKWQLSMKKVTISAYSCFFSNKELLPFVKNTEKTFGRKTKTFFWNNAYQNLKHDRSNGFKFGNVEALFQVMAALFILNIYYQDRTIPLNPHQKHNPFDASLGSSVFSVSFYEYYSIAVDNKVSKEKGMEEAIYIIKATDSSSKIFRSLMKEKNDKEHEYIMKKMYEFINENENVSRQEIEAKIKEIRKDALGNVPKNIFRNMFFEQGKLEYEAILNKNDF